MGGGDADTEVAEEDLPKLTFDDYEKMMKKIEADEEFEKIEESNPKAAAFRARERQVELEKKLIFAST